MHRITPSTHRSPTVSASPPVLKKRKQIAGESNSPQQSLKITIKQKQTVEKDDDDSEDRMKPRSHKDNPEVVVDDDDDKEREKQDDEMGSLEIRNEETQTTIPTPLRALRRMCKRQGYMIQDMERKCVTTAKLWETHNKIDDILHEVVPQIAENVTNDLIEANLKPCIVNTIIENATGESSSPQQSLKITIKQKQTVEKDDDDSEDRMKPRSHKDNPEVVVVVDDDDDKEREKRDDEMGSLEIRNEETQTTIPTPLRALRRMCKRQGYMIQDMERKCVTTAKFWETHNKIDVILHEVVPQIAENVTNDLIEANLKPCIVNTIIEDRDAFLSEVPAFVSQEFKTHALKIITKLLEDFVQSNVIHVHPITSSSNPTDSSADLQYHLEDDFHTYHDEHQDDDAPPEGEKRVKSSKKSKISKSARGSSSKHSRKDSTTYVSKQQSQHQELDACEEENVVDEDEVIPEDVTPELIVESQNVDKRVPTIFYHTRIEATLRDFVSNLSRNSEEYAYHLEQSTSFMENQIVWESRQQDIPRTIPKTLIFYGPQRNPNEPPRPLYNKDIFFLKYGNTEEKKYILSLHKIHVEEFPEPDLEEKLNR
ncbi:hypothetical protein Tco_1354080 [Tanacetum coccineum]